LPFKTGKRWSLFKAFDTYERARAWFKGAVTAIPGDVYWGNWADLRKERISVDSVICLRHRGPAWCVFVKVDRKYLPALEARIVRDAT
jgi:hypothetical protein